MMNSQEKGGHNNIIGCSSNDNSFVDNDSVENNKKYFSNTLYNKHV